MSLITLDSICKHFGEQGHAITVLENISFSIDEGQFVCLVGPSGCGKSTLLRIMTGLESPSEGRVLYRDHPLAGVNLQAAMVFQSFALLPWLTVMENVALGLEARGVPKEERERRANIYIDKVGLDGYEEAYPKELSGGMKQRAGIARALTTEPTVLCLDEPFSALDTLTAETLRTQVLDLWSDASLPTHTMVMVTHSIEEAVQMAGRIIVFATHPGRVIADIPIPLERPRHRKEEAFQKITDQIYSLIV